MKHIAPLDAGLQLIVNQVRAHVQFHVERQRDAGHTPDECEQERAALVAGIVGAMRANFLARMAQR